MGLLQPLADGGKLFFKEEIIPTNSSRFLFILGPSLAMLVACMTSAVIPWGDTLTIAGRQISLQVADVNIGILYIFGVVSLGVYGIMLGGWASNNKYSLLASVRAASQIISYELAMGLALIALLMHTGSLSLKDIVEQQRHSYWNFIYQPLGFLIFLVCAFAECNRTPFDLPEAENELNGGYHLEYSSMKLGFYLFAEYINMFISSALMASLYFGGYSFPGMDSLGLAPNLITILGFVALFIKILVFLFFFMWVRWTIPRFRYDQLMRLGWNMMIPIALVNMLITGAWILFKQG
jgi:NADH-quinone oxidoreductase subunit H